jgi:lipopolysaccharide transport system ATP-binding protein
MSELAIQCVNLSKRYRIGERQSYGTLRDTITNAVASPLRRLRASAQHHAEPNGNNRPVLLALDDVSFEVHHGEVVGIIGRNGAGKSTLLKILSRVTKPSEGYIKLNGRVGSLLEVGTGFHPELTGRENIYLNGAILGMKKAEIDRNFDEIVAFAEVEKFIDTPVKRYSSGMYMRLAFSVAAHLEPEILIVDEVLAVGDAAFQKKCLGKMDDAAKAGRTVLFVSHNMGAIQRLCSRCLLLDSGRLSIEGDPRTVVPEYLNLAYSNRQSELLNTRGQDCEIRLSVTDERGEPTRIWYFGQKLTVKITILTRIPLVRPAVDISFHSDTQARLFALQSDRLGQGPEMIEGCWNISFEIENPGLTVSEMYFDVGLRQRNDPYMVLVREAGRLFSDYTSTPAAALTDCLLYPQAMQTWEAGSES